MIAASLFLIAVFGVIDGAVWLIRNELARRRAGKVVFPPMRVLEVRDEMPF